MLIEGNTIENIDGINLRVSDATGVVVRQNRFLNTQQRPSRTGADRKLDSTALVLLDHCRQVELSGNTVTGRGAGAGPLVVLGPEATAIVGAPGGVTEQRGN